MVYPKPTSQSGDGSLDSILIFIEFGLKPNLLKNAPFGHVLHIGSHQDQPTLENFRIARFLDCVFFVSSITHIEFHMLEARVDQPRPQHKALHLGKGIGIGIGTLKDGLDVDLPG